MSERGPEARTAGRSPARLAGSGAKQNHAVPKICVTLAEGYIRASVSSMGRCRSRRNSPDARSDWISPQGNGSDPVSGRTRSLRPTCGRRGAREGRPSATIACADPQISHHHPPLAAHRHGRPHPATAPVSRTPDRAAERAVDRAAVRTVDKGRNFNYSTPPTDRRCLLSSLRRVYINS